MRRVFHETGVGFRFLATPGHAAARAALRVRRAWHEGDSGHPIERIVNDVVDSSRRRRPGIILVHIPNDAGYAVMAIPATLAIESSVP